MKPAAQTTSLPVTIPPDLHAAIAAVAGQPFADSYLSGAHFSDHILRPRTAFARDRIAASKPAMRVLGQEYVTLGKPLGAQERKPVFASSGADSRPPAKPEAAAA